MKQDEIRRKLIEGAIHVIAQYGLDKASTKQIGTATNVNEGYIYRYFEDKEDLFTKAFDALDDELFAETMKYVEVMYRRDLPYEQRCRQFFFAIWEFLLRDRQKCLTYMRYFYSPYFSKYSAESHFLRFKPLVKKFHDAFIEEADVWMILNHILNVMFDFAIKIHNDQMPSNDAYSEHVFRVVYASVKQYFKEKERQL